MRKLFGLSLLLLFTFCFSATSSFSAQDQTSGGNEGARPQMPVRVRIGGNVEAASLIYRVMPEYPSAAKAAHISGTVILHAVIGKDGTVQKLEFVSGPNVLMQSAMDAVKQWRYKPLLLNKQPVEVETMIAVVYTLDQPSTSASVAQQRSDPTSASGQEKNAMALAEEDSSHEPYVYEAVRGSLRYEDDGTGSIETSARIRVQTFAGVQQMGQLVFEYSSDTERLDVRTVRVTKPDGRVVVAGPEAMQDLSAPVAQLAPIYTDARQKHITVPGLSAGDLLEYDVVKTVFRPLTPGQFWNAWNFVSNSFCRDETVDLNVPAERTLRIKSPTGIEPTITEQDGRRIYHWHTSNTAPMSANAPLPVSSSGFDPTKLLEGAQHAQPRRMLFSTFQSWADVGRWYTGLERDRRAVTPELRAKAEELIEGEKTDTDKANAIYSYVSRNIRYVSLSFGVGRYQPHAAEEVFSNQYGDCKDKATLLGAMLAAIGIKSSTALINSQYNIDPDIPTPMQFDHAITVASIDGSDVWLDSTLGIGPYAYLLPQLRGKDALVVAADGGAGEIRQTPDKLNSHRLYRLSMEGKLSHNDADMQFSIDIQGDDLEVLLRLGMLRLTPEELAQEMTQGGRQRGGNGTISDLKMSDPFDARNPLHIEAHFSETKSESGSGTASGPAPTATPGNVPIEELLGYVLPSAPAGDTAKRELSLGTTKDIYVHLKVISDEQSSKMSLKPVHIEESFAVFEGAAGWQNNTFTADFHLGILADKVPADKMKDYADFRRAVSMAFTRSAGTNPGSSAASNSAAPTPESERRPSDPALDQVYANAIRALDAGNPTSAAEMLETVVQKNPNYRGAWNDLGRAYTRLREFDKATSALQKAIQQDSREPYAYNNLGLVYLQEKKYDQAISEFQKQIAINEQDRYAHANLGRTYVALEKFDQAAKELNIASAITPNDAAVQFLLGRAYVRSGQAEKGTTAFARATSMSPTASMLNDAAYELADSGAAPDQAEKYARSALTSLESEMQNSSVDQVTLQDLGKTNAISMFWDTMGWVKFREGDSATASKYLRASWQLRDDGIVADHLGQLCEKEGRRQDAIEYYEFALATNDPPPATRTRLMTLLGTGAKTGIEAKISEARARLSQRRTVLVSNPGLDGESNFIEIFSAGENKAEVKLAPGADALDGLSSGIASAQVPDTFPDGDDLKIVRRGRVSCTREEKECKVVFVSAESAASVF